jgi:hypothetical protein
LPAPKQRRIPKGGLYQIEREGEERIAREDIERRIGGEKGAI